MLTVVLFVFGFLFIACIALLFLATIVLDELSHGWFLGWADKSIRSSEESNAGVRYEEYARRGHVHRA